MTEYIISATELSNNFQDFIILDCRAELGNPGWGYKEYLKEHISGSHFVDGENKLSDTVTIHGGRHPLPDLEILRKYMEDLGISDNSKVAAYGLYAARTVFILRLFGIETSLISGDFNFLKEKGLPVDSSISVPEKGHMTKKAILDLIRNMEYVKERLNNPSVTLIDSRAPERFHGVVEPLDKIAGHIPGAVNFLWEQIKKADSEILSENELKKLYSFIDPSKEIIIYCGSGVTACYNWIALKHIGIDSSIYAGSWSDWISYEETPKVVKK